MMMHGLRTDGCGRFRAPRRTIRGVPRVSTLVVVAILQLFGPVSGTRAQSAVAGLDWTADAPVDTTGLSSIPGADMEMLYERTLFRVDVLQLSLRFGEDTADQLTRMVAGRDYDEDLAVSVTDRALQARDVLVRSRFLRDVSLEQFLDGVRDNLRDARDAGLLTTDEQQRIVAGVATSYQPLRESGIRAGETVWYRIHGDRLQVAFQALDGSLTLDLSFEGSEHRRAILGGYLAPASDFRDGLIRSLFARSS